MDHRATILIGGWRFLPHSYAVVNQFQCLELLRRPQVKLYFEDLQFCQPRWQPVRGLFSSADEQAIAQIPPMPPGMKPDAELRIVFPYDLLRPPRGRRTCVCGTSEFRVVPGTCISEGMPLDQAHRLHDGTVIIVTPSHWSRRGFLVSGADPNRLVVVPHGVDQALYYAPTPQARAAARARLRLADDEFVFLAIGAMTDNKNLPMLLQGFASVLRRYPGARLVLKGLDALYTSRQMLSESAQRSLPMAARSTVLSRLMYIGRSLPFADMARLYHAADCYVSPYHAEAFNLPVLEAAACGLPVICTAGGATDEFVTDQFAWRIGSREVPCPLSPGVVGTALMPSYAELEQLMHAVIADQAFRQLAFRAGPAHVGEHYTWKHVVDTLLKVLLGG